MIIEKLIKERKKIMKKIIDTLYRFTHVLELVMGLFVLAAILMEGIAVIQEFGIFWTGRMEHGAFMEFLELVLNLVVGVEFLKMLLRPSTDTILEVLMFVIARHMVVKTTTSFEDLLSVISVAVLLLIRKYAGGPLFAANKDKDPVREEKSE